MLTLDVSKCDKSNEVNEPQFSNILFIQVALDVLKFDKSKELNEEQLANIYPIYITFDASKFLKLIDVNEEHPSNIFSISLIFDESNSEKSISAILSQFQNIPLPTLTGLFHSNLIYYNYYLNNIGSQQMFA